MFEFWFWFLSSVSFKNLSLLFISNFLWNSSVFLFFVTGISLSAFWNWVHSVETIIFGQSHPPFSSFWLFLALESSLFCSLFCDFWLRFSVMRVVIPFFSLMVPISGFIFITKNNFSLSNRIKSFINFIIIFSISESIWWSVKWCWIRFFLEFLWNIHSVIVFKLFTSHFLSLLKRSLGLINFWIYNLLSWFQSIKISVEHFFLWDMFFTMSEPISSSIRSINWIRSSLIIYLHGHLWFLRHHFLISNLVLFIIHINLIVVWTTEGWIFSIIIEESVIHELKVDVVGEKSLGRDISCQANES